MNDMKKTLWIIGILASFFALSFNLASAQDPTPSDDAVNAIARQLFCPVCENTPLDVCPTQACHQWRELIRQMLAQGKTADEIKQYFVDNYGARVLSEPPASGLNWLVYGVPPILFLGGAYLLYTSFRTWKRGSLQASAQPSGKQGKGSASPVKSGTRNVNHDPYAKQLEDELRKQE
jgi:cytochrome c-type biogenesis protein CcmH